MYLFVHDGVVLRGPAAILFISRDTCSDGLSHNYRAICAKCNTICPETITELIRLNI